MIEKPFTVADAISDRAGAAAGAFADTMADNEGATLGDMLREIQSTEGVLVGLINECGEHKPLSDKYE